MHGLLDESKLSSEASYHIRPIRGYRIRKKLPLVNYLPHLF